MAIHHKAVEKLNKLNPKPCTHYGTEGGDPSANPVFQTFEQQLESFMTSIKKKSSKRRDKSASLENVSKQ